MKDTIEQWLEGQIIKKDENKVYIHYNGWGTRWDEWIELESARIAPFRTYTIQTPQSNYLSPYPNIKPDSDPQTHEIPEYKPEFPEMVNHLCLQIKNVLNMIAALLENGKVLLQSFASAQLNLNRDAAKIKNYKEKREEKKEDTKDKEEEKGILILVHCFSDSK